MAPPTPVALGHVHTDVKGVVACKKAKQQMNPLTLYARGNRTDRPKEHLQTQAGVQENQHTNRRKEESASSACRKWIIYKTMCKMNQLGITETNEINTNSTKMTGGGVHE